MGAEASVDAPQYETFREQQPECAKFLRCFEGMATNTARSNVYRVQAWMALDINRKGFVSLAETCKWIKDTLTDCLGQKEGDACYKFYYGSFIRAFKDAATNSADRVRKSEFRLLCAHLCLYAIMYSLFSLIDGGANTKISDEDRRITLEELRKTITNYASFFKKSPFRSLAVLDWHYSNEVVDHTNHSNEVFRYGDIFAIAIPQRMFTEMDTEGKGMVLLGEFCAWIKKSEIAMLTNFGETLRAGTLADQ